MADPRSRLPSVTEVLAVVGTDQSVRDEVLTAVVRGELESLRAELSDGDPHGRATLLEVAVAWVRGRLDELLAPTRAAINATGVVLHTGLGRARLGDGVLEAVAGAAGAVPVELDERGRRGHRDRELAELVTVLTTGEDATFANNGAGALMLALRAAAGSGRVAVSRGELIEIGGSFRLPDVISAAGVELVEIGTTNRTRVTDVEAALADGVTAVLVAHPSNYRIDGFVERPALAEVARACGHHGAHLVHDIGSGLLKPSELLPDEPSATTSLAAGADLVTFSGDKLLGGPQAGIVVGGAELVGRARRDPLARALRLDKLRVAALSATLRTHLVGGETPTAVMLTVSAEQLWVRAEQVVSGLGAGADVDLRDCESVVGGGSGPGEGLASVAITLPSALAAPLRAGGPPVFGRVRDDRLWLDLRTVDPADDARLGAAILAVGE